MPVARPGHRSERTRPARRRTRPPGTRRPCPTATTTCASSSPTTPTTSRLPTYRTRSSTTRARTSRPSARRPKARSSRARSRSLRPRPTPPPPSHPSSSSFAARPPASTRRRRSHSAGTRRARPTAPPPSRSSSPTWPETRRPRQSATSPSTTSRRRRRSLTRARASAARCPCPPRPTRTRHRSTWNGVPPAPAPGSRSRATRRSRGARPWTRRRSRTASTTSGPSRPTEQATPERARSARTSASTTLLRQARSPAPRNVPTNNPAPSGSITAPAAGAIVGGTNVTLTSSVADGGSGVASVRYELRPTGGGAFTQIASATSAPFSATWDATTVSSGSYDVRPVITDRAGNTFTGGIVTFTVDVTAPTVTLANPGGVISGNVTLNATVSGTGAANVVFAATPAGGATWKTLGTDTTAPWSIAYDSTKLTDGVYDLRATVADNLGNSSQDVVSGVRVDNTAPTVVSSSPADGSSLGSVNAISLVASEPATPTGVTLDGAATVAAVINGTSITYNTGALAAGPHTLAGELQDANGKHLPFRVHFTVGSSGAVEKNTSSTAATTVNTGDGFGSATVPPGAWSTSGNDWLVVRISPAPAPSGLTNGFGPGPEALDVSAHWALSGAQVHEFAQPIEVVLRSTEPGLVPATYDGSAWRVIHRIPTAGSLPAGWDDGFFTAADGVPAMTRHLSSFALMHDLKPPQP